VPGVDFNGGTTGLSADGRTLILEALRGGGWVHATRLLVLDTKPMRVVKTILLQGWSTVDAISPQGRWLYLLHYPSPNNLTRYEVLAYDLERNRLIARPIVDPRDRGEAMTGIALSRVMSPGGRWAYTLYFRPSGVPFVHALDTAGLRAVCVDLPSLRGLGFGAAKLVLGSGARTLLVSADGAVRAAINTRSFTVSSGSARAARRPAQRESRQAQSGGGAAGPPWELILVPIAAVAALGAALWRRAKPRAA
jgi:hypothetical protein